MPGTNYNPANYSYDTVGGGHVANSNVNTNAVMPAVSGATASNRQPSQEYASSIGPERAPVSVLSTDNAIGTVNTNLGKLNQYSPNTAPGYVSVPKLGSDFTDPTTGKVLGTNKFDPNTGAPLQNDTPPPKAYFTNEAGQEAEFTQEQLNDPNNQKFLSDNGYVQTKTEGPSYNPGQAAAAAVQSTDKEIRGLIDSFNQYSVESDPAFQTYASTISSKYATLGAELKKQNESRAAALSTLGIRTGATQYAGAIQSGIEGEELAQANARLGDLASKESSAIADARIAFQNNKYDEFSKKVNLLEKVRDDKAAEYKDYSDKVDKAIVKAKENNSNFVSSLVGSLIADKGLTDAGQIAAELSRAGVSFSSKDIKDAMDTYNPQGSGIVQEYNYYKQDAIRQGLTPVDFNTYQNMDANRKAKAAGAGVAGAELDTKQQAIFNKIVDKYNASPAIKALDRANMLKNLADEVIKNPSGATNQLALIYSYIKGLDTDSAVREGEIDLVKGIQSYLSKWNTNLERVSSGKAISESAAKEIAEGAKTLISSIEDTAKRKEAVFKAQAKTNGDQVFNAWNSFSDSVKEYQNTGEDLVQVENDAKTSVVDYGRKNPQTQAHILELVTKNDPDLGRPLTYSEVQHLLNIQ